MSLIINGKEIEHTEWIRSGKELQLPYGKDVCWWDEGDYQTTKRAKNIDILCGHWTAGEAGLTTVEDDGPRVVYGMKNRMSEKFIGRKLKVSIAFVIGACDPQDPEKEAAVWQCLDLGTTGNVHVGSGAVNSRSIGVEIVSAGVPGKLDVRRRPRAKKTLNGRSREIVLFYPGQIKAWNRLANLLTLTPENALTREELDIAFKLDETGIRIPRQVPLATNGLLLSKKMTRKQMESFSGVIEHIHMFDTQKIDAALQCVESCKNNLGFKGVKV